MEVPINLVLHWMDAVNGAEYDVIMEVRAQI